MRQTMRALCMGLLASGAAGCIDHDYDLTEDMDMTLQLGGESLTVPASSTDIITLSQILDLDEGSSIQTVKTAGQYGLALGDYVLIQEGNSSPSTFDVPTVSIDNLSGSTAKVVIPEFQSFGLQKITQTAPNSDISIHMQDDNVTTDIVSIESADLDVAIEIEVGYESNDFNGTAYIEEGFTIKFDQSWTIAIDEQPASKYLVSDNNYTIRFKESYPVNAHNKLSLKLRLTKIDFTQLPAGQGLYSPGHFLIDSKIETSGDMTLTLSDLPIGQKANLTLVTSSKVSKATINKVRGIVDPKINISATNFEINDIPDFLNDPANHLDIDNPQIYLTVSNSSPLSIELDGKLTAYSEGNETATVNVGRQYGTDPIIVRGNSTTEFVICRTAVPGTNSIVIPNLSALIETIPDRFSFHDASTKAILEVADYTLGTSYNYNCDYKAVIPLAFGENMFLHYTHEEKDWDADLDKFNFNTAVVSFDAINAVPLDMAPDAVALDHNGNELSTIKVAVEGAVKAGSIERPTTSTVTITLTSTGESIKELDGVRIIFNASSNSDYVGVNLNDQQNLKFENIRITVKGGVLVDLND